MGPMGSQSFPFPCTSLVAKLTCASWICFSRANDRQKITTFIRRSKLTGFCSLLFKSTYLLGFYTIPTSNVLKVLLTSPADHNYNLRDWLHNRQLPDRMSHLTNCNFTVIIYILLLLILLLLFLFVFECNVVIVIHSVLFQELGP